LFWSVYYKFQKAFQRNILAFTAGLAVAAALLLQKGNEYVCLNPPLQLMENGREAQIVFSNVIGLPTL
jgi:hypothetical protein